MSTIAAIATGPAAGGVGIIRLSGPAALSAARRVVRGLPEQPTARHAYFTRFVDGGGAVLDEGLTLYFAGPKSFTGEDVVELHAHGAPRLLSLLLSELLQHDEVRLATPGEFTRRAYLSGRMELTRAEAVADLIAAESEAQVRAAAAQLTGEVSARLEAVHAPLLALQADVEGALDFPEEAEGAEADAARRLDALVANVRSFLADARRGALIRRGARVVLYGPVNAGKSTLFNALVGASRALVDAEPGTTRDTLEARIELAGLAVTLIDTAGLREGAGRLEALGIERTRDALQGADVAVLVVPPDATADQREAWTREVAAERLLVVHGKADLQVAGAVTGDDVTSDVAEPSAAPLPHRGRGSGRGGEHAVPRVTGDVAVSNALISSGSRGELSGPSAVADTSPLRGAGRSDQLSLRRDVAESNAPSARGRGGELTGAVAESIGSSSATTLSVSGLTGAGLPALRDALHTLLSGATASAVLTTSDRHLRALEIIDEHLARARLACDVSTLEVVAGEVSLAVHALAEVTGTDASTELLDAIFQRFCIGK
jgi:tRNA modification GTPase